MVTISQGDYDALYDDPATTPQLYESTWFADPDPRVWFIVWPCASAFNDGYCNPALDDLLDWADAELDRATAHDDVEPIRRNAPYECMGGNRW